MDMPIIRVQIDSMKESLQQAMMLHGDQMNEMIAASVEKALDPDVIQARIDRAVEVAINKAIDEMADNYAVKSTIQAIINDALIAKRNEIEDRHPDINPNRKQGAKNDAVAREADGEMARVDQELEREKK